MVYATAGVVLAAFGLAMAAVPHLMVQWESRRQPKFAQNASEGQVLAVRVVGVAFLAIGLAMYAGSAGGWL